MAKQTGLGDNLLVDGHNLSGDIGSVDNISSASETQEVTGIDKSAKERVLLKSDPQIEFTGFFNPTGAHPVLSALPKNNVVISYLKGQEVGAPACSGTFKQVNYDQTLGGDGSLTNSVAASGSDGYPLAWGKQLTAGSEDFAANESTAVMDLATATTGGYFTVHLTEFTGTTINIRLQDSPDNGTYNDVDVAVSSTFAAVGAAKIRISPSIGVDRWVRGRITGTFTTATIAVIYSKGVSV